MSAGYANTQPDFRVSYDEALNLEQARDVYFQKYGFNMTTYTEAYTVVWLGPIPVFIWNVDGRKVALKLHDLHHVLTGYQANWRGEFQVSAWEIASNCQKYWFAWFINAGGLALGALAYPKTTKQAFIRGLRSKNLYNTPEADVLGTPFQELLTKNLGETRKNMQLDDASTAELSKNPPTDAENRAYHKWVLYSWIIASPQLFMLIGIGIGAIYGIFWLFQ